MALSRHAPTFALALLGVVATAGATRLANDFEAGRERARQQVAFADAASSVFLALERELTAQLGVVDALVAFFGSSERVDADEFHTFATPFLQRFPGLEAVSWIPDSHLTDAQGTHLTPRFAEPADQLAEWEALDLLSRPNWSAAVQRATESGQRQAVAGPDPQAAPLRLLVLRHVSSGAPVDSDSAALWAPRVEGLVVAVTQLDLMAKQVLRDRLPGVQSVGGVDLYLFAGSSTGAASPLHVHQADHHADAPAAPLLRSEALSGAHAIHQLRVGDEPVLAVVRPVGPPPATGWSALGLATLLSGISLTGASTLAFGALASRAESVARLVDARTVQLRATTMELEARERHLRAIVESTVDGILTIDDGGIIRSVNPAIERMFGHPAASLLGQPVSLLMPEPHRGRHEAYVRRYRPGRPSRVVGALSEVEGQRADGSRFPLELTVSALGEGTGPTFLGVLRDISERKAVERMKDEFVSTVSHELRTPLTSMLGSLELLRDGLLGPLSESATRMVEVAFDSGERLVRLINDILDMERISTGGLRLRTEVVDGTELLEVAARSNRGFADLHGVVLVRELPSGPALVHGDRDRILQVLTNLIGNAVKFSPAGGRVMLSMVCNELDVVFHVTDQGPGIPEDFRARVFQPFSQADSTDRRGSGGTGLGLSIAKAIVEAHGGSIWFDTAVPRGTTFSFRLLAADLPAPDGASS